MDSKLGIQSGASTQKCDLIRAVRNERDEQDVLLWAQSPQKRKCVIEAETGIEDCGHVSELALIGDFDSRCCGNPANESTTSAYGRLVPLFLAVPGMRLRPLGTGFEKSGESASGDRLEDPDECCSIGALDRCSERFGIDISESLPIFVLILMATLRLSHLLNCIDGIESSLEGTLEIAEPGECISNAVESRRRAGEILDLHIEVESRLVQIERELPFGHRSGAPPQPVCRMCLAPEVGLLFGELIGFLEMFDSIVKVARRQQNLAKSVKRVNFAHPHSASAGTRQSSVEHFASRCEFPAPTQDIAEMLRRVDNPNIGLEGLEETHSLTKGKNCLFVTPKPSEGLSLAR
jgi:hypothetical protein